MREGDAQGHSDRQAAEGDAEARKGLNPNVFTKEEVVGRSTGLGAR